jgi:hypothetical protein
MSFKRLIVLSAIGLLSLAANAAQIIIPAAGSGSGANLSKWQSDVLLHNAAPRTVALNASFHIGTQVIGPKPVELRAKQTLHINDMVRQFFGLESGTGAIVFSLEDRDVKYVGITSRTYNNVPGGDEYGQDIPSFNATEATNAGEVAVMTNPNINAGMFRFNFGVYAIENTTVRWELLRADGVVDATKEVTYAAGEQQQHNNGVDRFLGVLPKPGDSLYARILSGKAIVYGSSINRSGDPSYVPSSILREDVVINFGIDEDENGTIDISDADHDGVLDQPITVYTSMFPAHFRIVVSSEFGEPVTLEVVESEADAVFRDANGTMRVGAAGDLKNKTGSIVVRATTDGTEALLTIPVLFR